MPTIDAVLDAMGYHANMPDSQDNIQSSEERAEDPQNAAAVSAQLLSENMSLGDSITVDSESESCASWLYGNAAPYTGRNSPDHLVQFAQDLLISAGTPASEIKAGKQDNRGAYKTSQPITSQTVVVREIARRLNSLSLESSTEPGSETASDDDEPVSQDPDRLLPRREGFVRGQSEPPAITSRQSMISALPQLDSPPSYAEQESAAYTWEWGGFPTKTPGVIDQQFDFMEHDSSKQEAPKKTDIKSPKLQRVIKEDLTRSNSTPVAAKGTGLASEHKRPQLDGQHAHTEPVLPDEAHSRHTDGQHGHLGKLKNDEEDPYKFMLDTPSVCHTFELSMCAPDDDTDIEVSPCRPLFGFTPDLLLWSR